MNFTPFGFRNVAAVGGGLDPDASTYLAAVTAAGGTYTPTQETAVNNLFVNLKANSLYTKILALYPFVGGVAAAHAINACNIGTYTITFTGGWTHTASGITANGTTARADTGLQVGTPITVDNAHYSYRQSNTTPQSSGWDGYYRSAESKAFGLNLTTGGQISLGLYDLAGSRGALPNFTDVFTGTRTSTTNGVFYRNATAFFTLGTTRTEYTTKGNYFIGALNENGTANYYNNNRYNFYTLGTKILSTEISAWSTVWNTYITEMGR